MTVAPRAPYGGTLAAMLVAAALLAACGGHPGGAAEPAGERDALVQARWADDERPPERFLDGDHPRIDGSGVEPAALDCGQVDLTLVYHIELDNPYERELDVWAFASLDTLTDGYAWGLFQFELPPGRHAVLMTNDHLGEQARRGILETTEDELGVEPVECSIVFLGIADGGEALQAPVVTTRFDG